MDNLRKHLCEACVQCADNYRAAVYNMWIVPVRARFAMATLRQVRYGWSMRALALSVALLCASCGGGGGATAPEHPKGPQVSELETFFPLEDGKVYAYLGKGDATMLVVLRVARKEPSKGALRSSNAERVFTIQKDSIARVGGGTVLKMPIAIGTAFAGDHGGAATIEETNVSLDVPAGHYTGCIRTVEKPSVTYTGTTSTTFCPGVGIVKLEVQAGEQTERMELQSYGDPVKI